MAEPIPSVPDPQPVNASPRKSRRAPVAAARSAIALAAAFGGISPNILRMAVSLTGDKGELPLNASYWIGLLLFALLGGAMGLIWGETQLQRAYYLGLGLPSLLQVGVSSATENNPRKDAQQEERAAEPLGAGAGFWLFTPPAYAQERQGRQGEGSAHLVDRAIQRQEIILQAPPQQAPDVKLDYSKRRSLALQLDSIPEGTELLLYADKNLKSRVVLKKSDQDTTFNLPLLDSITEFRVLNGSAESEIFPIATQPGSTSVFRVDVDKNWWSGFFQAVGARNVNRYDVEVEPAAPPTPSSSGSG
jgi:hypothetical protein